MWDPDAIIVEDAASGQSLIQELKTTNLPLLPVKIDSDKVSRAQAVTPLIESGRVFLPQSAGWLDDYVDELANFPNGAHDDAVDSTTNALNYFRSSAGVLGVVEWMKGIMSGKYPMPPDPAAPILAPSDYWKKPVPPCPKCAAVCITRIPSAQYRCGICGEQWGEVKTAQQLSRKDISWPR